MWLFQRAKYSDDLTSTAAGYGNEAVADIESRHGIEVDVTAAWIPPRQLTVTAATQGMRFTLPVPVA